MTEKSHRRSYKIEVVLISIFVVIAIIFGGGALFVYKVDSSKLYEMAEDAEECKSYNCAKFLFYLAAIKKDAKAMTSLAGIYQFKDKNLAKAIEWHQKAIDQGSSDALFCLALHYYTTGEYAKGENLCRKGLIQKLKNSKNMLILFLKKRRKYEEAIEIAEKEIKAGNNKFIMILSGIYEEQHKYDKAITTYKQYIATIEKDIEEKIETWFSIAEIYLKQKQINEAEESFQKAQKLSDDSDITLRIADYYLSYNCLEEAEKWYEKAMKDNNAEGYEGLGDVKFKQKKYHEALKLYQKAKDLGSRRGFERVQKVKDILRSQKTAK